MGFFFPYRANTFPSWWVGCPHHCPGAKLGDSEYKSEATERRQHCPACQRLRKPQWWGFPSTFWKNRVYLFTESKKFF